ncbi:hypothetical protein TOK_5661 [Pseudonocardia sp. N23]|nr:hypothetical protein TOK_5661 [Pseudonocardia sp. N23]
MIGAPLSDHLGRTRTGSVLDEGRQLRGDDRPAARPRPDAQPPARGLDAVGEAAQPGARRRVRAARARGAGRWCAPAPGTRRSPAPPSARRRTRRPGPRRTAGRRRVTTVPSASVPVTAVPGRSSMPGCASTASSRTVCRSARRRAGMWSSPARRRVRRAARSPHRRRHTVPGGRAGCRAAAGRRGPPARRALRSRRAPSSRWALRSRWAAPGSRRRQRAPGAALDEGGRGARTGEQQRGGHPADPRDDEVRAGQVHAHDGAAAAPSRTTVLTLRTFPTVAT